jgi:hypothetical protein
MAFTLAEVLITLLIIGVVASLVIPAIIQDTQNAELKAAWKKSYSELSQATTRLKLENTNLVFADSWVMRDKYIQYLSLQKNCANLSSGCWHLAGNMEYYNGVVFTATNLNNEFGNHPAVILSNGALVVFNRIDCSGGQTFCGHIAVDINGFNGPNTVGKDILRIWVLQNQIQPEGSPQSNYPGSCPGTGNYGWGCSARYLYN